MMRQLSSVAAIAMALGTIQLTGTALAAVEATQSPAMHEDSYTSGLSASQLKNVLVEEDTDQGGAFAEGSAMFTQGQRKHLTTISDGQMTHFWAKINEENPNQSEQAQKETIPGKDYTGAPIALNDDGQQHFIGRHGNGEISHHIWSADSSLKASVFHNSTGDAKAADAPAFAMMGDQYHMFYVDQSGSLQHQWADRDLENPAEKNDWSQLAGDAAKGVTLVGQPSVYEWHGQQHVVARTAGQKLAHFFWDADAKKLHFAHWDNITPVASDPATLATHDTQAVFYVDRSGNTKRIHWDASTNRHHNHTWSEWGSKHQPAAVGRPQVFGVDTNEHVVVRHVDGSVSHSHRGKADQAASGKFWLPADTTTSTVAAGKLLNSIDVATIDRYGKVATKLQRTGDGEEQSTFEWGRVDTPSPMLPLNSKPELEVHSGKGRIMYAAETLTTGATTMKFATRVHSSSWLSAPEDTPRMELGYLESRSGYTGTSSMWRTPSNKGSQIAAQSLDGAIVSFGEADGSKPTGSFTTGPDISLVESDGDLAVATQEHHGQVTGLAVHTRNGVMMARVDGDTPGDESRNKLSWKRIHEGNLEHKNVEISPAYMGRSHVYLVNNDGQVQVANVNSDVAYPEWHTLPALPEGVTAASDISAVAFDDRSQRILVRGSDNKLYSIRQSSSANAKDSWDAAWQQAGDQTVKGNPSITALSNGTMRIAALSADDTLLFGKSLINDPHALPEVAPALGQAGELKLAGDPVAHTMNTDTGFKYVIMATRPDGNLFAVAAVHVEDEDQHIANKPTDELVPVKLGKK